jgi:hypothetical protein
MTSKLENNVRIVNGPSKWDLMLGLFEGKKVEFTVETTKHDYTSKNVFITHPKNIFHVQVNSIEAEDGSRESWNITGGIVGITQWCREPNSNFVEEIAWRNCKIYFHTRCRRGNLDY